MADKNEIEVTIKVGGQDALVSLEKLRRALKDVDRDSSLETPRKAMEGLTRTAQYMGREVGTSMRMLMGAGGVGTLGAFAAGGIVAGILAAGNALSNFGRESLKLHDTARELGVTAEALKRFQLAGQAAGMSSDEAASSAENALRKIQDLQRRGLSSDFYNQIVKAGGDATGKQFADAMIQVARSKGPEEAMRYLLTRINSFSKGNNVWAQSTVQNLFGISSAAAERMIATLGKLPEIYIPSKEEAAKFALQTTVLSAQLDGLKTRFGNALLEPMTKLTGQLTAWLDTDKGKEFQDSIVKLAESLEQVKWGEIADTARSTLGTLSWLFSSSLGDINNTVREIKTALAVLTMARDAYSKGSNQAKAFNQLSPEEQRGKRSGGSGGSNRRWHRRRGQVTGETDTLGIGLPELNVDGVDPARALRNRMLRRPRGDAGNQVYRFSGGGTDLDEIEEKQRNSDLIEQMTDVTDEVRRLNDFMFGPAGGGAGGMGPTGGGGGLGGALGVGSIGGGGSRVGGGGSSSGGSDDDGVGSATRTVRNFLKSPTSPDEASNTLDNSPLRGVGSREPLVGGEGPKSKVDRVALQNRLTGMVEDSPLNGMVPRDGARWGIKTGSPQEWAAFMTKLSYSESGHKNKTWGDRGSFGIGSRGLFQLSPADAQTYKLNGGKPFTLAQLEDPEQNAQAAVQIMAQRVRQGGLMGREGAQKYWAHGSTFRRIGENDLLPEGASQRRISLADIQNTVQGSEINVANSSPLGSKPPEGAGAITYSRKTGAVPEELRQKLEYAGLAAGVRTAISSGIEPGHKRHTDQVPAADLDLHDPATGRKLDSSIPADREKMKAYITAARAAGATGIGMGGPGQYMGASRMHIGESDRGHPAAVWGDKGSGPNTPAWVREAYNEGERNQIRPGQRLAAIESMRKQQSESDANRTALAFGGAAIKHLKSQTDDADSDRKAINSSLMGSMAKDVVKGSAAVNIDVGGHGKNDDNDLKFSKVRSKGGPSMPNTPTNTSRDSSSGDSEDGKNDQE